MYNLANALLMQQKAKDAMEQFEAASKVEKDKKKLSQIYHNMGVILQSSKQYPQCIEAYKKALRNNPADDETRYNLALAQKLLKDQQQNQDQNKQQEQKQDKKDDDKQQKNKEQQDQKKKDQQDQNKQQEQKQDKKDDDKQQKNKEQQDQKKKDQQNQNQQQQQNQNQMSKQNAEQLLKAAMQDEKNVQDKVKKGVRIQGRKLEKDW
mgnify:CR=1 FL=1